MEIQEHRKIDKYCWICQGMVNQTSQYHTCVICPRIYHERCMSDSAERTRSKSCMECNLKSVSGTKFLRSLDMHILKECLIAVQNRVSNKQAKYRIFQRWSIENDEIVYPIDFGFILDKIFGDTPYKKTVEIYSDAKWFYHNYVILYRDGSVQAKLAKELLRDYQMELLELEACVECYYHMYSYNLPERNFVRLCNPPHDIIWAKMTGFAYWPAKCLNVVNNKARVTFFGEHEGYQLNVSKCYHISKEHPEKKRYMQQKSCNSEHPNTPKYLSAMDELEEYISLYEEKVCTFRYYETRKLYEPTEKLVTCIDLTNVERDQMPRRCRSNPVSEAAVISNITVPMNFTLSSIRPMNETDRPSPEVAAADSPTDQPMTLPLDYNSLLHSNDVGTEHQLLEIENFLDSTINSDQQLQAKNKMVLANNGGITSDNQNLSVPVSEDNHDVQSDSAMSSKNDCMPPAVTRRVKRAAEQMMSETIQTVSNISESEDEIVVLEPPYTNSAIPNRTRFQSQMLDTASLIPHVCRNNRSFTQLFQEGQNISNTALIGAWSMAGQTPAEVVINQQKIEIETLKTEIKKMRVVTAMETQCMEQKLAEAKIKCNSLMSDFGDYRLEWESERQRALDMEVEANSVTMDAKSNLSQLEQESNTIWGSRIAAMEEKAEREFQAKRRKLNEINEKSETLERKYDLLKATYNSLKSSQCTQTDDNVN